MYIRILKYFATTSFYKRANLYSANLHNIITTCVYYDASIKSEKHLSYTHRFVDL